MNAARTWRASVKHRSELPADADEGDACFVSGPELRVDERGHLCRDEGDEQSVWVFEEGAWRSLGCVASDPEKEALRRQVADQKAELALLRRVEVRPRSKPEQVKGKPPGTCDIDNPNDDCGSYVYEFDSLDPYLELVNEGGFSGCSIPIRGVLEWVAEHRPDLLEGLR